MTKTIPTATLLELIALGEKATERPWAQFGPGALDPGMIYAKDGWLVAEATIQSVHGPGCDDRNAAFIAASANLAVPLAEEVLMLRGVLREVLASGTESMTTNYRVVKIDHQTWSDAQEAIGAQ